MENIKKAKLSLQKKEAVTGWVFIAPVFLGFCIFTFGSIVYSLFLSFNSWDFVSKPKWAGLSNYIEIFTIDPYFYKYLINTLYFVVILVPVVLVISFFLAVMINKSADKLVNIYKGVLFLPSIISTVAVSLVWKWIFNDKFGMLNNILRGIGISNPPGWLGSEDWAKPAIIIMRIWQMSGYYMLLFLAGLQVIPKTLYEAAEVDGATKWQQTVKITLPMVANTTFAVTLLLIIEAFNVFEAILLMTPNGGFNGSTGTIMYYIYSKGFEWYQMGYASALAWIFFIIIMGIMVLRFKLKKEERL